MQAGTTSWQMLVMRRDLLLKIRDTSTHAAARNVLIIEYKTSPKLSTL
jgi:hypothetical protein